MYERLQKDLVTFCNIFHKNRFLSDFVRNKRLVSFKSIPIIQENVHEITQNASIYTSMCLFG